MSRVIVTHVSRTVDEIAQIVAKSGAFMAPLGLPHYRYENTRHNLGSLVKWGLLKRNGKNDIHHYFIPGEKMAAWKEDGCPQVRAWVKGGRSAWDNFFSVINKYEKSGGRSHESFSQTQT